MFKIIAFYSTQTNLDSENPIFEVIIIIWLLLGNKILDELVTKQSQGQIYEFIDQQYKSLTQNSGFNFNLLFDEISSFLPKILAY